MSMPILPPQVLRYAPWSISKADTLERCPSQFHYRYVLKEKEARKGTQALVGVSAHAIQEFALLRQPTHEVLVSYAQEQMEQDGLTGAEKTEVAGKLPGISDFVKNIQAIKAAYGVRRELIEHKLAMNAQLEGCDFNDPTRLIRGVLDYGLDTSSGVFLLIDHKSGKRKPIQQHSVQFYVYMAMIIANYPDVLGVQSAINYFGAPELDWFPTFSGHQGPWTREDIVRHVHPWLVRYLSKLAKPLTVIDAGAPTPVTGWQCDYCGYVDHCPQGTLHVEERRQKKSSKQSGV